MGSSFESNLPQQFGPPVAQEMNRNDTTAPVATSCQQLLQVSLLEKGDEITAVDVRLPGWKCFRDGLVRPCPYPRRPSLRCFGD